MPEHHRMCYLIMHWRQIWKNMAPEMIAGLYLFNIEYSASIRDFVAQCLCLITNLLIIIFFLITGRKTERQSLL